MANEHSDLQFELICIIVDFGLGSKIVSAAKKLGLPGGTVFLGRGTARNKFLEMLDLCDVRKEIVFIISNKVLISNTIEELSKKFTLNKPNHGIAFTLSLSKFIGCKNCSGTDTEHVKGVEKNMNDAIFVFVERGKADEVIQAASLAGSKGGTIINARGAGIHETQTIFAMPIEPEKEIVIIIAEKNITENVVKSIKEKLNISVPGNGMMFVLDVNETYGMYK